MRGPQAWLPHPLGNCSGPTTPRTFRKPSCRLSIKRLRPLFLPLFSGVRGNRSSRKFPVTSGRWFGLRNCPSLRPLAPPGRFKVLLVTFVARTCSKSLRIATGQLPRDFLIREEPTLAGRRIAVSPPEYWRAATRRQKGVKKARFVVLSHLTDLIENPVSYVPNSLSRSLGK